MFMRYTASFGSAAVVTFGLLLLMQLLIAGQDGPLITARAPQIADFLRVVRYTVTQNGTVRDVEVVESTHHVFEQAAVDAAYRFKYRPRVVRGEPVEVHEVVGVIRFVLSPGAIVPCGARVRTNAAPLFCRHRRRAADPLALV